MSSVKLLAGQHNVLLDYELCETSYEDAWKAFRERYDNPKKLKLQYFNNLLSIKKMTSTSPSELRRIIDSFTPSITTLNQLKSTYEGLLVHVVQYRLDENTAWEWQKSLREDEVATWDMLKEFLTKQWRTLDQIQPAAKKTSIPEETPKSKAHIGNSLNDVLDSSIQCTMCEGRHKMHQCEKFLAMNPKERFFFVRSKSICRNCLSPDHVLAERRCSYRCRVCQHDHHSLLHFDNASSSKPAVGRYPQSQALVKHPFNRHHHINKTMFSFHSTNRTVHRVTQPHPERYL